MSTPLIDDIGTPLGVQPRLMRQADIKTTMITYGSLARARHVKATRPITVVSQPSRLSIALVPSD
jgi:hypothetical protein